MNMTPAKIALAKDLLKDAPEIRTIARMAVDLSAISAQKVRATGATDDQIFVAMLITIAEGAGLDLDLDDGRDLTMAAMIAEAVMRASA